jgi:hypothetical protein
MLSTKLSVFVVAAAGVLAAGFGMNEVVAGVITPDERTIVLEHFDGMSGGTTYGAPTYEPGPSAPGMDMARRLSADQHTQYDLGFWSGDEGTIEMFLFPEAGGRLLNFNWLDTLAEPPAGHVLHLQPLADQTHLVTWRDVGVPTFHLDGPALPYDAWVHLAVSWGGLGTKIYIDGEIVVSSPENASPNWPAWAYLNYWGINGDAQFQGLIDELHISSIQRSDAEIRDHAWIPEPTSLSMLTVGGSVLQLRRRRRG